MVSFAYAETYRPQTVWPLITWVTFIWTTYLIRYLKLKEYLTKGLSINNHKIQQLEQKLDRFSDDVKQELKEIFNELRSLRDHPINIYNQI